jgi:LysM repeat protein
MRATTLLLSAALTLCSTATFAQSNYNIIVEPVVQSVESIINAPIEYDENGVVKAQHFNADDLTDEEYQALLDEAARIRAYRDANGLNFDQQYIYPETTTATVTETAPSYQVELFAPEISATTVTAPKIHTVSKGDTLYNISKRYDTSIAAIQSENGLSGTALSIGQRIRIPGVIVESINTVSQPIFASAPVRDGYVTRRIVEPAPVIETPQVEFVGAAEAIYAVLPKDTLYSISRRTCVGVKDIIARNNIANPNALTPGQRITLPVGHCVTR